MSSISINYALKWEIDFANEYQFSECRRLFNTKIGREIKKVYNSRCLGYCIKGKFYSLSKLKSHVQKIKKKDCPF